MGFVYIAFTILFTVYGQLMIKYQMDHAGAMPEGGPEKVVFILYQLTNIWILSSFAAAFIASLFWMAAMTKFELSFAYPFMSLSFVLVMALTIMLFGESLTVNKVLGTTLIVAGLVVLNS